MINTETRIRHILYSARDNPEQAALRSLVISATRELPKSPENLDLFRLAFELAKRIEDQNDRNFAVIEVSRETPFTEAFHQLYQDVMEAAIIASDALDEPHRRITELLRIAKELPSNEEFLGLRRLAWRLVLGLADRPRQTPAPLEQVAMELPKGSDYTFYRRYTLLGIAKELLKDGDFPDIYKEAIEIALKAVKLIDEPYYRKYTLIHIAKDLPLTDEFYDIYKQAINEAYDASLLIKDPFAQLHALIDMFQFTPKTHDFFPLLKDVLTKALGFFTIRNWVGDLDVLDVVDYILSAEEMGVSESKKRRFDRGKYANRLTHELEKLTSSINDTRFIEVLRPYTHAWVQPKALREAVRKVVEKLEALKSTYHGREVERPVFVGESHPTGAGHLIHRKEAAAIDCIAIDVGATNTVIVRKKGDAPPDFVVLPEVSRQYDSASIVPTVLSPETNTIGTGVIDEAPILNIKQMMLEGNPKGREYMERFFRTLYQHIKKATSAGGGWFSFASKNAAEKIYLTVPVGYQDYKKTMRGIAGRVVKGAKVEFIEEPLAAAVGYQVIEQRDKVFLIIDFGGSTMNTMIVRLNMNEVHVVAKPERAQIFGGQEIDAWVSEHLAEKFSAHVSGMPLYRLLAAAEEVKIGLSDKREANFIWNNSHIGVVTRHEFEEVLERHEFYRAVDRVVAQVVRKAEKVGLRKDSIEAVLLTGGSSQIPSFKEKIGHIFPLLRAKNLIYDHSPLTAVATGAALYGTRDITDRHLAMAYAMRYATVEKDKTHSSSIVLEKGEILPLEKTFRFTPARKLGMQNEVSLEMYEVPEGNIVRRWISEGELEFLKQELKQTEGEALNSLNTITITFKDAIKGDIFVTFCIDSAGALTLRYGPENTVMDTGLRLQ